MPDASNQQAAIFLDRDGVINRKAPPPSYVRRWSEFELLPGVLNALATLHAAGATLLIVTNQRGVARSMIMPEDLAEIHGRLAAELAVAGVTLGGIYVCEHETGTCQCRKPGVGLFLEAQRQHPWISFESADLVGDSLADMQAGHRLGMRLWLVGDRHSRRAVATQAGALGIELAGIAPSLAALVDSGTLLPLWPAAGHVR